jgi:hypothetical protein
MFKWYANSCVCYALLEDVEKPKERYNPTSNTKFYENTSKSRWYDRGWTLQELIAPQTVEFYDKNWTFLGSRADLCTALTNITGVSRRLLSKERKVTEYSIAARMSYASHRKTTRKEDMAYCLLGIMDVNMPLLYGEGANRAFLRLQHEIIKNNDDHSIFAWKDPQKSFWKWTGLLAPSPEYFTECNGFRRFQSSRDSDVQTNGGRMRLWLPKLPLTEVASAQNRPTDVVGEYLFLLDCNTEKSGEDVAIRMMRIHENEYVRVDSGEFYVLPRMKPEFLRSVMTRISVPQALGAREWVRWEGTRLGACVIEVYPRGTIFSNIHPNSLYEDQSRVVWRIASLDAQSFSCDVTLANGQRYELDGQFNPKALDFRTQFKCTLRQNRPVRSEKILEVGNIWMCWDEQMNCGCVKMDISDIFE